MMSFRGSTRQVLHPARVAAAAVLLAATGLGACMHIMGAGAVRPDAASFGYGPRVSGQGLYSATIEPERPLVTGRIQSLTVRLHDAGGGPIEGASLGIDGGMPEHGHGLPTKPRMTAELGAGAYRVEGLKFNMGGWWELKFAIVSTLGTDTVTFNVSL